MVLTSRIDDLGGIENTIAFTEVFVVQNNGF